MGLLQGEEERRLAAVRAQNMTVVERNKEKARVRHERLLCPALSKR